MLYRVSRAIVRIYYSLFYRLEARGVPNIPTEGPVILCCNHRSLQDPFALGAWVPRKVHYMAKEELFKVPIISSLVRGWGAFPVKRGGVSKEAIRSAINLLKEGHVMGIFPEGKRNKTLSEGKRGAVTMALRSGAAVVPVALIGKYRFFSKVIVVYGAPIDMRPYAEAGTSESQELATQTIMARIAEMLRTGQPSG
jgi:1-acyl-sn-glycerol-3-phosphate acyltransferase